MTFSLAEDPRHQGKRQVAVNIRPRQRKRGKAPAAVATVPAQAIRRKVSAQPAGQFQWQEATDRGRTHDEQPPAVALAMAMAAMPSGARGERPPPYTTAAAAVSVVSAAGLPVAVAEVWSGQRFCDQCGNVRAIPAHLFCTCCGKCYL